jgi:hypothetical protein
MNGNHIKIDESTTRLRIIDGPEAASSNECQMTLFEARKLSSEQAEIEEFWAGRNLAARMSARRAA